MKKSLQKMVATGAMAFAAAISLLASTSPTMAAPLSVGLINGNNGTLKVHEIGTASGTENNDPKVCKFNIESFGLDLGQVGYLIFDVRGQDTPKGTSMGVKYAFGAANVDGYAVSQDFNNGGVQIADGHYKVTLYGKDISKKNAHVDEVKAKSKVFKVACSTESTNQTKTESTVKDDHENKPEKPANSNKPAKDETPAQTQEKGIANNGTLKIHEIGMPVKTNNNDPKVCAFDIEGFKFDKGQTGYLKFSLQGKDAPIGVASEAVYAFGPTDTEGYALSTTKFNTQSGVKIANGHYKVTLYGKDDLTDEKAKSKVFKVICDVKTPSAPVTPTNPTANGGHVLGSETMTNDQLVTIKSEKLANTGISIVLTTLASIAMILAAWFVMKKRTGLTQEQIDIIAL